MKDIYLKNITNNLDLYNRHIDAFLDNLESEKKYFHSISKEMIMRSNLLIAALHNCEIVGICGLEKKYIFEKKYIIINKNYQGDGIGTRLSMMKLNEAKKKFDLIVSVTKPNNIKVQKLNFKVGYKMLGRRDNHDYFIMPLNLRGYFLF